MARTTAAEKNAKLELFLSEYLKDFNASRAIVAAGSKAKDPANAGWEYLSKPEVQQALAARVSAALARNDIEADKVLAEWWSIATADARDLVELRRGACRFCHGEGFKYQRTPAEREAAWAEHQQLLASVWGRPEKVKALPQFDELGGVGYTPNRPAHPDCPECWGDGIERVVAKDSRTLQGKAVHLYAGAKVTRDGLQVQMHDKLQALGALGKYLRLTPDASEHSGPNGGPIRVQQHQLVELFAQLTVEEQTAIRPVLLRLQHMTQQGGKDAA